MISNLGTWFSIAVLAVALLIAILLTSSGLARRTRESGTLKALGWSNNREVAQVAGESMVRSIIGGIAGLALGLGAVAIINASGPVISARGTTTTPAGGQGAPAGMPSGGPVGQAFGNAASQAQDIVLHAPVSLWIVLLAIGLAILSGLVAGAFGGWRAARAWWSSRTSTSRGQLTKVRRDYIGFVFQDFNLIPTLNAYENVNTALEGRAIFNAEGLTIIAVTHDSGVAARAKRRLHLQGGQIFDESDPALRRH